MVVAVTKPCAEITTTGHFPAHFYGFFYGFLALRDWSIDVFNDVVGGAKVPHYSLWLN